jgi:hypothetical protein
MRKKTRGGELIRLPKSFFDDHDERGLPCPEVIKTTKPHYWVAPDDPVLAELLSDAEHYCDPNGPDAEGLGGLKRSAKATVKAIQAAYKDREAELTALCKAYWANLGGRRKA